MNKIGQRLFVTIALVACLALAGAQGTGGGGQGQGGRGRGGFGQRGMAGRGGGGELQLAMRADVQKELTVTDDQKKQLEELNTKIREARRAAGGGGAAGAGGRGQGQRNFDPAAMAKQRAEEHKSLAAILNEKQMKRLGEISLQQQGNQALTREEVQKALGMTEDQIAKVKATQDKQREAMQSVREKMQNQELTREEAMDAMQKNSKALNEELAKVLTADQAAKFKEMQGSPFKLENTDRSGGGGGGGY